MEKHSGEDFPQEFAQKLLLEDTKKDSANYAFIKMSA
jgi:hypothetical protein